MPSIHVWYIRRKGEVKGPYPCGLITRYILLGRVRADDEISADGIEWTLVSDKAELIPDAMKAPACDPHAQQRLEAARRWADERNSERRDRAVRDTVEDQRQRADRRAEEEAELIDYRLARTSREIGEPREGRPWLSLTMVVAVVAIVIAVAMYFYKPLPSDKVIECNNAPAPHINWSNCGLEGTQLSGANLVNAKLYSAKLSGADLRGALLSGSDLSYATLTLANLEQADLRDAVLIGANLRGARLIRARLDQADLSYADLTGVDLTHASLHRTRFDRAIWPTGVICAEGSLGSCVPPE